MAKRRAPFKTNFAFLIWVVRREIHLVRSRNVTRSRVINSGQLIAAPRPRPLIAAISRHWKQPVPVRTDWREPHGCPGNITLHVGVNMVDGRRTPSSKGVLKLFERLCAHESQRRHIRRSAWFQPVCSHCEGAVLFFLHVNDRTVAREPQVHWNGGLVSNFNFFVNDAESFPLI